MDLTGENKLAELCAEIGTRECDGCFLEDFAEIIGLRVVIFRVCLAGLDETADFAAILKGFVARERVFESTDLLSLIAILRNGLKDFEYRNSIFQTPQ